MLCISLKSVICKLLATYPCNNAFLIISGSADIYVGFSTLYICIIHIIFDFCFNIISHYKITIYNFYFKIYSKMFLTIYDPSLPNKIV